MFTSKIAEGYFTIATGGVARFLPLPFIPNTIEMWNKTKWGETNATAANGSPQYAIGFAEDAAGTAYYTRQSVNSVATTGNFKFTTGGFSFISAGTYAYGPVVTITGVSQANPAVVTAAGHGLATGDTVFIYETTGMLQIAGVAYTVTVINSSTFSINVDSSGFAAPATAGFFKKVLYPDLYIPELSAITGVTTGVTTTIQLALVHSFVPGNEIFFTISPAWGMTELDSLTVVTQTGIPQQAYVISVTAQSITVNVNSTGYTAFAYPTSANSVKVTPATATAAGDQNSGLSGVYPPIAPPITIPGAFTPNTRQGVIFGASLLLTTSDVIRWRAVYPDLIKTSL